MLLRSFYFSPQFTKLTGMASVHTKRILCQPASIAPLSISYASLLHKVHHSNAASTHLHVDVSFSLSGIPIGNK